ncbi:MAG: DUF4080 domain-containing protein, partial [Phycisphaerae bacterium]|nr:DUF4080 domain-containing protein [Phycisphaerae bacterium]
DINQRTIDILDVLLSHEPRIIGLGVYIWNVTESTELIAALKRLRPDITIILGGPEVSYETAEQRIAQLADFVITGEADLAFGELCEKVLDGRGPLMRIVSAALPEMDALALPYTLYDDNDIAHRVVYIEASRGCPFKCEFCLSSLDVPVRNVPLDRLLDEMQRLLDRGLRQFKFVDRTFNLNLNISRAILQFFLDCYEPGLFLHFEMIPDRLPTALRELISRFPNGALQFEVGIQTFNNEVAARISRRQDLDRLADNLTFLREHTGVHVHADLIAGLPGENIESFANGFDRLVSLRPHEIQVGILKRLRGTPIVRHDDQWQMVYSPNPPYEVLRTKCMDFATLQRVRRFSRYWDLIANSGNFTRTAPLLWHDGSPFQRFMQLSDWMYCRGGRTHSLALQSLAQLLFDFLTSELHMNPHVVAEAIWADYVGGGRSDRLPFLRPFIGERPIPRKGHVADESAIAGPARQKRHQASLQSETVLPPN